MIAHRFITARDLSQGPLISVIIPAYNPPAAYFEELIYSVISQAYQNWELIIINASSQLASKATINNCRSKDTRIRTFEAENKGISINTNYGIKMSKGDYVAFVDHDDVLEPFALYEVAQTIIDSGAELVYTDEDKISDNGENIL